MSTETPTPRLPSRALSASLLAWYDRHHRRLPWRTNPNERKLGVVPDPYHVWLSEIMLQQTTVAAVKGYFEAFVRQWPSVDDLAAAADEDVMKAWAGLGYYSRARNLKKCAEIISHEHGGAFPTSETELLKLPGVGPYTAAAISAIAFNRHAAVVDGNVERVLTRLHHIEMPLPEAKPDIRTAMADLTPEDRPGDFAQAVMDLGASLCSPRRPTCGLCPWTDDCEANRLGMAETLPRKAPKKPKPTRKGAAFVVVDQATGAVLLRRRPPRGLLGGMSEVPGSTWSEEFDPDLALLDAPLESDWIHCPQEVRHTFTHFHLELRVYRSKITPVQRDIPADWWWSAPIDLDGEALPTVMRKVLSAALGHTGKK